MKQTNEELLKKFGQIKGWICGDIIKVIGTGANYLTALGLLSYTEIIGSFITGKGEPASDNFDTFFRRLGSEYDKLLKKHNKKRANKKHVIYDDLRCGLLHEYVIKRKLFTIYHIRENWENIQEKIDDFRIPFEGKQIPVVCGVMYLKDQKGHGSWHFISPRYFFDFQKALEDYWCKINNPINKKLRKVFFERARAINLINFSIQ
jgi:hypothetical protein